MTRTGLAYEVTLINKASGVETTKRVSALSIEDARRAAAAPGFAVGPVREVSPDAPGPLEEMPEDHSAGRPLAGQPPAQPKLLAPPGAVLCPDCGSWAWKSGRGLLINFVMLCPMAIVGSLAMVSQIPSSEVIASTFPLVLLLIPRSHECRVCHYAYRSHATPPSAIPSQLAQILLFLLICLGTAIGAYANWDKIMDAISP
jgi:rubredoxin